MQLIRCDLHLLRSINLLSLQCSLPSFAAEGGFRIHLNSWSESWRHKPY